ncbi:MAG TPA: hypothetical protein VNN80_21600, partial [Polyangiaceae bacterium]|nr:hypothetical protein [Polyangiaceae bacterium]
MRAADARGRRVLAWGWAVAFGLGCGEGTETTRGAAAQGTAARQLAASWPDTFASSADKQALILDCLERFVPHAEGFFRASDLAEARSDGYDAEGAGVTQPRGAGNLALAWVTLLEGRPEQAAFGGVARETLLEHTIQSIRHEALTSSLSGYGYDRWGNGSWQASLEAFSWAFAAWRLWPLLDAETQALVRTVITGEADILIDKPLASGEEGDTGAEDNAWNAKTPALAEVMFPDDPRAPGWHEASIRLALNAVSTAADADAVAIVDAAPLSQRIASVNLHPDLTLENHGFFNPIYQQVTHLDVSGAALAYAAAGRPLPEALSFRTLAIWDEILEPLATDEGDFAMVAGQDWTSKDYQHVAYLGLLATRFQRADAAALEGRALGLVARRQALSSSGALLGQPELGYESMLIERLAVLWWHHRLFGPAPIPTPDDVREGLGPRAPRRYPDSDFVAARLRDAFVSMSWDAARPLALVIPRASAQPRDPIFSYYAPLNLVGGASGAVGPWSFRGDGEVAGGFATAGNIGARRFALVAFADGVTALLDRGEGPAFNYALEEIPGLTGLRPIASEAGQGGTPGDAGAAAPGELSGSWANVAERLGLIVRGGAGMRLERIAGEGSRLVLTGSAGTGSGNRGAWLLPLVSSAVTAELEPAAAQLEVGEQWAALGGLAPDGSRRLALARWGGYPS